MTCYYNSNDAKLKWQNARNLPDAPQRWAGVDFDEALVMQINKALDEKCSKDYGADCLLAVSISPNLTTFKEMDRLVPSIEMPTKHQFKEIYLVGNFGVNNYSNVSDAIWKLYPN